MLRNPNINAIKDIELRAVYVNCLDELQRGIECADCPRYVRNVAQSFFIHGKDEKTNTWKVTFLCRECGERFNTRCKILHMN